MSVYKEIEGNTSLRITIQIDLSGYSFRIYSLESDDLCFYKEVPFSVDADVRDDIELCLYREFGKDPLLQRNYEAVDVYVNTPKHTLIPKDFHNPSKSLNVLKDLFEVSESDELFDFPIFNEDIYLTYLIPSSISSPVFRSFKNAKFYPVIYYLIQYSQQLQEYNKVLLSYSGRLMNIVILEGRKLLFANTYDVSDLTTLQYYLLVLMKEAVLNPKQTILRVNNLTEDLENTLKKYFKDVKSIDDNKYCF